MYRASALRTAPQLVPLEAGYKIAPMDTVSVKVFKMPDLTGDYEVDLAGHISMPLIGEVSAYDLTTAQLDDALTRKLGEKYLENPDVSVGIKSSTRRSVTVDGAVNKSGSFPVNGPTTLMQAVAAAGGAQGGRQYSTGRDIPNDRRPAPGCRIRPSRAFGVARRPDPQVYAGDIVVIDGSGDEGCAEADPDRPSQSFRFSAVLIPWICSRSRRMIVNNNLAVPDGDGSWVVDRYSPDGRLGVRPAPAHAPEAAGARFCRAAADHLQLALADPRRGRAWPGRRDHRHAC